MSENQLAQIVEIYDKALALRDGLQFKEALELFAQIRRDVDQMESLPFRIAFDYDMALALDLAAVGADQIMHEHALALFRQSLLLYEVLATDSPHDPAVTNFAGLVWGMRDYLSLWDKASIYDDNYLNFIKVRQWDSKKFPLRVFIDQREATGFDSDLRNAVWDGFCAWTDEHKKLQCERTETMNGAAIIVRRVSDGLGSAGGHTAFEESDDGKPVCAKIRIALRSHDSKEYSENEMRALRSLAMHEAGHALGLDGHSPHATDLLYWKSPLLKLSPRDIKTLKLVYAE